MWGLWVAVLCSPLSIGGDNSKTHSAAVDASVLSPQLYCLHTRYRGVKTPPSIIHDTVRSPGLPPASYLLPLPPNPPACLSAAPPLMLP